MIPIILPFCIIVALFRKYFWIINKMVLFLLCIKMIFFHVLIFALLTPYGKALKIHKEMSFEEVREVFQTSHEDVPEYEVVNIKHMRHKRSGDALLQAKSFGKNILLYLEPSDGLLAGKNTNVYTAESNSSAPNGIYYLRITNALEGLEKYYQDVQNNAAITVKKDKTGEQIVEGTIGDNLAIRPLPEKLRQTQTLPKHDYDFPTSNGMNETDFDTISNLHHFFFKTLNNFYNPSNFTPGPLLPQFSPEESGNEYPQASHSYFRSKRDLSKVIYPEILVVMDEKIFSNFSQNVQKTVSYLLSFWNGVDLRFRSMENPKVRINIAGIILSKNKLPYEQSALESDAEELEASDILESMGKYFYQEKRFKYRTDFDAVLYMTGYNLVFNKKMTKISSRSPTGLGIIGGACRVNDEKNQIDGVGTFKDNGGFEGVSTGAHELAHLLGVPHDGEDAPINIGGPGAKSCDWDEGFIMSYVSKNANTVRFSSCSLQSMRYYIESDAAECLRNVPKIEDPLPRVLPGKYMSLDEQCKMELGTSACFPNQERNCVTLYCKAKTSESGSSQCLAHRPAAEGSSCGDGKFCLNGKCISETTSTVPGF